MIPMNGLEFLKKVRTGQSAASRDLPIIVLTGSDDDKVLGTALALDCDGFLKKPSTPKDIATMIHRVMTSEPEIRPAAAYEIIPVPDPMGGGEAEPMPEDDVLVIPEGEERLVPVHALRAGLHLAEDLMSDNGHRLLAAGVQLTDALVHRLQDLSTIAGVKEVKVVG